MKELEENVSQLSLSDQAPSSFSSTLELPLASDRLLPARKVWERYGVADRTLDRWLTRPELRFPRPVVVNRRRYFRESDLLAWERFRAASTISVMVAHP